MVTGSEVEKQIQDGLNSDKYEIDLKGVISAFTDDEKKQIERSGCHFSDLVERRCGAAFACISKDTISKPDDGQDDSDKRASMHSKPSGFPETKKESKKESKEGSKEESNGEVDGKWIFQRCHLIGHQLYKKRTDKGSENANLKRIFTGTRFMNNVMLYYEQRIYDYVKDEKGHVLYRVTPRFTGNNILVDGVQMEALFIDESGNEDMQESFYVFVYNKQPYIDYETGKPSSNKMSEMECDYVIDEKKKKFHIDGCASVRDSDNKKKITSRRRAKRDCFDNKYNSCGVCDWERGYKRSKGSSIQKASALK